MRTFEPNALLPFAKMIDDVAAAYSAMLQADLLYHKERHKREPEYTEETAISMTPDEFQGWLVKDLEGYRLHAEAMRTDFIIRSGALAAAWTIRFGLPSDLNVINK